MYKQGFTLTELVILMGILLSLFALTTGASFSTITQSQAGSTASTLVSDLRATQTKAMLGSTPSTSPVGGWGIVYATDHYIIFPGTTYVAGAPSNTVVNLPTNVTVSSDPSTIVFLAKSGALSSSSPIPTITVSAGSTTKVITLNPWGVPYVTP